MNRPPRTKLVAALGGAVLAASTFFAEAAGLGRLSVNSSLGQPLSVEIELVSLQPGEFEALAARVASPEAYTNARIEFSPLLRQLRFTAERRADGKPVLKVTSSAPINEPFLDVLVEVNWPSGKLLREYPILLDPPGFSEGRVAPPVAAVVVIKPTASNVAPAIATQPSSPPAARIARKDAPKDAPRDTYGPVKSGDTLNQIASSVKPDTVSLEQMLVAMYRENKAAFIGNNMNQLKTGQILRVPSAADVGKITRTEAQNEIKVQVSDWKNYRDSVAGAAQSMPAKASSGNEGAGKIAVAKPDKPVAASSSGDQLKIAKSEGSDSKTGSAGAKGSSSAVQDQLNALKEEAIAKDNRLKEANSRVAELEKQIVKMRELMELKGVPAPSKAVDAKAVDIKTAKVDDKPKAADPAKIVVPPSVAQVTPAAAPGKLGEPAKAIEPPKVDAAKIEGSKVDSAKVNAVKGEAPKVDAPKVDLAKAEPPKVDAAKTEAANAAKTEAPKSDAPKVESPKADLAKPVIAKAPPPSAPTEPSFIEENAVAIFAAIAVLLATAGLLFTSRRKKKPIPPPSSQMVNTSSIMPSDMKPNTVTGNRAGGLVDTGNSSFLTDFDKTGPGMIDTDEVDPVAEAEVYIAYGRDAQAEEILKEAMGRDKNRHEIAVKLLEIYHSRKSPQAFEPVARELKEAIGVDNPTWAKVAALGASIDPANPLYGGVGGALEGISTGKFAAGGAALAAGAVAMGSAASTAPVISSAPDLDFDLGFTETAPATMSTMSSAGTSSAGKKPAMDFDLDLNSPVSPSELAALPHGAASQEANSMLDFDLAFDVPPETPPAPVATAPASKSTFDFDLSSLSLDTTPTPSAPSPSAPPSASTALDDIFATTIRTKATELAAQPKPAAESLSGVSFDLDTGAVDGNTGTATATKLELAKAYIEIGDAEGAREILQEVSREGSAAQREAADKILAGI